MLNVTCVLFDGHRQLELLSVKNAMEAELDAVKVDVKQKNSVIDRLHDEVIMMMTMMEIRSV